MFKRIGIILFWFAVLNHICSAQNKSSIQSHFNSFLNDPALRGSMVGFSIMNADDGNMIFSYHDSLALIPASCLKIATTGAALGILSEHYRFKTKIVYQGNVDASGILHGDVIIIGGGDPVFGSDRWGEKEGVSEAAEQINQKIIRAGIKKIEGKLIVDISRYDNQFCCHSWACDDTGNYFGAGASAFNFGENKYDLRLQSGTRPGLEVKIISTSPELSHYSFENCLTTGGPHSGDQSNIYPGSTDSSICVDGSIPLSKSPFVIKGAIPNPSAFAASYISKKLYESGMLSHLNDWQIECGGIGNSNKNMTWIDSIQSPDLKDIIYYTNLNSINLYAECMLKEMGYIKKGIGTRQSGVAVVKKYWHDHEVDTSGLFMDDGCGLSKSDRISALQLCKMLSVIKQQFYYSDFLKSLPVAGQSGAMKSMGKGTAIDGIVFCKTGHINGIRAYSGYIKNKSGKWECFTLIVNNYTSSSQEIHNAIEKLLIGLGTANYSIF